MPPHPIPVADLRRPLLLRRRDNPAGDDFAVEIDAGQHGRLVVGRIMSAARPGNATAFLWTVTGPAEPEAPVALSGDADDLPAARAAFRAAFDALLLWASMERQGELRWLV
jgi:hypothetical protein